MFSMEQDVLHFFFQVLLLKVIKVLFYTLKETDKKNKTVLCPQNFLCSNCIKSFLAKMSFILYWATLNGR